MSSREQPMLIFSQDSRLGNEYELGLLFVDVCSEKGAFLGVDGVGALNQFFTFAQARKFCPHLGMLSYDCREIPTRLQYTYLQPFSLGVSLSEAELKANTTAHDKLYQRNDRIITCCT